MPRAVSSARVATREPVSDLAGEISLLDEARDALATNNPARALARLDEYDRIPAPRLAPEAAYIRIEAFLARGDAAAARAAAHRFLAAHPTSPHAKRVRALLESLDAPNP
jgi:outer membrane protein assembly factor BamD (BamD/ComL family)